MTGQFKTLINDVLTLGHPPGPDTLHNIAPNAAVTLDNQSAHMGDIKPNDEVTVEGDPATVVTVRRNSPSNPNQNPAPNQNPPYHGTSSPPNQNPPYHR